jgi:hypothetical protein
MDQVKAIAPNPATMPIANPNPSHFESARPVSILPRLSLILAKRQLLILPNIPRFPLSNFYSAC